MAGSTVLRVLSVSMTSTRSSDPSHLFGLAGPTGLRLNRMDLPCSRCFLWLHAGGTEPREHLRPLALPRPAIPPSPLSDRVGYSDHVRFRGYVPVHCRSGLQPPCLRFATAVTGRHARLGSQLLARLCRGRHRRRQTSTRLQGATLIEPDRRISRIRLSDKSSRFRVQRLLQFLTIYRS